MTKAEGDDLETARVGYQIAVTLAANEQAVGWSRMNAMLTVNSIFIAAILVSLASIKDVDSSLLHSIPMFLAFVGLAWSIIWLHATERRAEMYCYWIASARELERHLGPVVMTVIRGRDFSKGCKVSVDGEPLGYNWFTRTGMKWWRRIGQILFSILYLLLFVYGILFFRA